MNALQYPDPSENQQPRRVPRRRSRKRPSSRSANLVMTAEVTAKVVVNSVLSVAAITTLANLLPYHFSQQAKLREVRREVRQSETQVNQLRQQFSRSFDPRQSETIMEEQSGRVNPNQRRIIWIEKEPNGY